MVGLLSTIIARSWRKVLTPPLSLSPIARAAVGGGGEEG